MRVLVTGHDGYIGCALLPALEAAGHSALGADSFLFAGCTLGDEPTHAESLRCDVRSLRPDQLAGFDAVVHLAGISNDPLGDLSPECTYDVNYLAAVRVADLAKTAGIARFVFASSCSLYGFQGDAPIDETAPMRPVTPYGRSKQLAEEGMRALASDGFSPTFLRNGTAYGVSARLRGDLVVNNLAGLAFTTGEVLMKSDGSPWRPLVHIDDISAAVVAVLAAPREVVHNEAFNVGAEGENYRIRDVAEIVQDLVPGSQVRYAEGASPDKRNYRVDFSKMASRVPSYRPGWTVARGVAQLRDAFVAHQLTFEQLMGPRFQRLPHIRRLQSEGRIDDSLRWSAPVPLALRT
ncbi:MAG: NAD-dependent epimerase/dehydratase family protein [Acidimicrobiales bacterium]